MSLQQGILAQMSMQSELAACSGISPKGKRWKKSLAADLLLTALIDAFSILVIFLLMSFSSSGDLLYISKGTELPKASLGDVLERNPVIKVEEGQIFIEDKLIPPDGLVKTLVDLKKNLGSEVVDEGALTIQGDRRLKYELLNQVVLAASHAGFSDIRFAVVLK